MACVIRGSTSLRILRCGKISGFKKIQLRPFYGNSPSQVTHPKLIQRLVAQAPENIKPYLYLARAHLPIGSYLLFWPCSWSLVLATPMHEIPDIYYLSLFAVGAVLMRGAGCVVNDLWDQRIDKLVDRTKDRPLASGALTTQQAVLFLGSQLLLGLGVLLQFNWFAVGIGLCSMPFVIFYPSFKRFFNWPQLILGMTFNWGAFMGFAVLNGELPLNLVLPLYLGGVAWTLHYDTIYAHQDKEDDVKVGVKSTALTLGDETKKWLVAFSVLTHSLITFAGYQNELSAPFYVGMGLAGLHLWWQISTLNINSPIDCAAKFRSNKTFGFIIFVSFLCGKMF